MRSFSYFVNSYCRIVDTQKGTEFPFKLWPEQEKAAKVFEESRLVVALKARQLGMTWLADARVLQQTVLRSNVHGLLFSLRDIDAKNNLVRVYEMAKRLPDFMRPKIEVSAHELRFSNGSKIFAFPTTAGDSYTASIVLVDEADIVPKLGDLLRRVKPTIDNGGQLLLVSRSNKDEPESEFKRIYRAAKAGQNTYAPIFLPWNAHPDRDEAWYETQKTEVFSRTGGLDDLYEQYPSTDAEALAARALTKRIPWEWLHQCFEEIPQNVDLLPSIPGVKVWQGALPNRRYVIGVDVAEGKETSDDSAAVVLDDTGAQVAELAGRIEISVYAEYLAELSRYYNNAHLMVERNNHGHAVILRLSEDVEIKQKLMRSKRDGKYGYQSDARGKAELYSCCAETCRDTLTKIRSWQAFNQLNSIERSTLLAPSGMLDDVADAYALACVGLSRLSSTVIGDAGVF